jgi:hypothetical protein
MYAQNLGNVLNVLALYPVNQALSASANSTAIDLTGAPTNSTALNTGSVNYEGQIACTLDVKNVSGTTPTLDAKLQHSDDNSTFVDVTGGGFTQVTTVAGRQKVVVDKDDLKRYLRVAFTLAGTSPVYAVSGLGLVASKNPA